MLLIGRLLGGDGCTSLLFHLQAWLVAEHNKRGFQRPAVGTFSKGQLGNIRHPPLAAGLVAQLTDMHALEALSATASTTAATRRPSTSPLACSLRARY